MLRGVYIYRVKNAHPSNARPYLRLRGGASDHRYKWITVDQTGDTLSKANAQISGETGVTADAVIEHEAWKQIGKRVRRFFEPCSRFLLITTTISPSTTFRLSFLFLIFPYISY